MLDLKKIVDFDKSYDYRLVSPVDNSDLPILFRIRSLNSKHVQHKRKELLANEPDIEGEDLIARIAAYAVEDVDGDIQLPESDKAMNPKRVTDIVKVFKENFWVAEQVFNAAAQSKNFTNG